MQQKVDAANGVAVLTGAASSAGKLAGKVAAQLKGNPATSVDAAAAAVVAASSKDTPNSVTMAAIKMARCVDWLGVGCCVGFLIGSCGHEMFTLYC